MSSTSLQQRTFALVMALLFLATSVAGGALVIWQINEDRKRSEIDQLVAQQSLDQSEAIAQCQIEQVDGQEVLPAPEVITVGSEITELQTTDLVVGEGKEVVSGDCVIAKYYGTLATSGELFDENFTTDQALQFSVGASQVIEGWDVGVAGMREGGTRSLTIPADLAYGESGSGSIPPNSALVFVVKLIRVAQ